MKEMPEPEYGRDKKTRALRSHILMSAETEREMAAIYNQTYQVTSEPITKEDAIRVLTRDLQPVRK